MKQMYIIRNLYLEHEQQREFKNHERKLQHVHSVYTQNTHENTSSQVKEIHLKNHRQKLIQSQYNLNKNNQKILNRLVDIASGEKNELNQRNLSYRCGNSLNQRKIKNELNRINTDNEKLAQKLISCESKLRVHKMESEYNLYDQYKNLALKFRQKLPPLPIYNSKNNSLVQQNSVVNNVAKQQKKHSQYDKNDENKNNTDNNNSLDESQLISQIREQLQNDKMNKPVQTQQDYEDINKEVMVENKDIDTY